MEKIVKASLFLWWWEEVCIGSPYPPFHRLLEFCALGFCSGSHWEWVWVAVVLLLLLVPPVLPSLVLGPCAPAAGPPGHLGVMLHPLQQPHSCGAWPELWDGPGLLQGAAGSGKKPESHVPGQGCSEGAKNTLSFWCTTCRSYSELVSWSRTGWGTPRIIKHVKHSTCQGL